MMVGDRHAASLPASPFVRTLRFFLECDEAQPLKAGLNEYTAVVYGCAESVGLITAEVKMGRVLEWLSNPVMP